MQSRLARITTLSPESQFSGFLDCFYSCKPSQSYSWEEAKPAIGLIVSLSGTNMAEQVKCGNFPLASRTA